MGLKEEIIKAIDKMGFKHPTPIQRRAIPSILSGIDCVAMARTGSGKTAAFAIPTIHRLSKHNEIVGVRAIVLSPTRELAMQTCKVFQLLSRYTDLRIALIVGGHSMDGQFDRLMNNPDVIIATPGRLIHHLEQDGGFSLERVEMLLLDEADRLFELGFSEQVSQILKACPSGRQTMLFSATLPTQLVRFAKAGLQDPEFVRLDSECSISEKLSVFMAFTRPEAKSAALVSVLRSFGPKSKSIVFVATRHHVDFLGSLVEKANIASVACIYGSLDQIVRTASLNLFKSGKASVLIVTDVAARGLDIPDVDNVVHYDFPCSPKLFIHRSGRTARAGKSGQCLAIVTASDVPYLMDLTMFIDAHLFVSGDAPPQEQKSVIDDDSDDMVVEVETAGAKRPIEIGAIPFIDEDAELVQRLIESDPDLESGKRSMDLSMGPYFKTRPSASKQAVTHSHEFLHKTCGGPQALLDRNLSLLSTKTAASASEVLDRALILSQLRNFRPSQQPNNAIGAVVKTDTRKAFELRVNQGKRARELARVYLSNDAEDQEESLSEDDVPPRAVQTSRIPKQRDFKSKDFFHQAGSGSASMSEKEMRMAEIESHQMDISPETHEELNHRARFGKKWDPKKMKYVTVRIGADGKAIKNEAGKRMTKKDLEKGKKMYKDWSKKSRKRIQRVGELEVSTGAYKNATPRPQREKPAPAKIEKRPVKIETPKSVQSKDYHGEVPWQYLTNKQKRLETRKVKAGTVTSRGNERHAETLKTPQSISKARTLKSTRKILQNPKKRKEFHQQSKDAYKKKQQTQIEAKGARGRSWVKGSKGGKGGRK